MSTVPSEVTYKSLDSCVCGCIFKDHDSLDGMCWSCWNYAPIQFLCLKFKLDNLAYIEKEAVKRNLI